MKKIRVLIVDDHRVVREGLAAILRTKEDIEVVGEAQDGREAVERARTLSPDVILMDISMPRMDGVEATRLIKKEHPRIGIVVLTVYEEEEHLYDLARLGAIGYLLKDSDSAQIVRAIKAIDRGESIVDPAVATKILTEFSRLAEGKKKRQKRSPHDLTQREIEVLQMIAEGKTNKEVANFFNLSEKTVKNHVRKIFQKLQVKDRTQAAIHGIRTGLIEIDTKKVYRGEVRVKKDG